MNNKFSFTGKGAVASQAETANWQTLNRLSLDSLDDPLHYQIEDEALIAAVNTALTLGMPLLLTGAPGVGKTQLAHRIAYELNCSTIEFSVKSDSNAQDLFYHIDHLRRLHTVQISKQSDDVQTNQDTADIRHFIRFQGLGLAILRAMPEQHLKKLQLWQHAWPDNEQNETNYGQRQPSVVLIDEIDKAPMDFSNDMLEEIRRLQFRVPELGEHSLSIYQNPQDPQPQEKVYRPQIIITSNSQKGLPEAFLRRCVYYHINPPSQEQLQRIVDARLKHQGQLDMTLAKKLQTASLQFYIFLRDRANPTLERAPSTAELLNWLLIMNELKPVIKSSEDPRWPELAAFCLLKNEQDQANIKILYKNWQQSRQSR